jgi:hypothetical protein
MIMQRLLTIFFDDLRLTIVLLLSFVVIAAFFGAFSQISDKFIQNEKTKENIENIESISINGFYLLLAISGIGTVLALLALVTGIFDDILELIRI